MLLLKCIRINIYFSQQKQRNIDFSCLKAAFLFHLLTSQLMYNTQSYFLSQKHGHIFISKWTNWWTSHLYCLTFYDYFQLKILSEDVWVCLYVCCPIFFSFEEPHFVSQTGFEFMILRPQSFPPLLKI